MVVVVVVVVVVDVVVVVVVDVVVVVVVVVWTLFGTASSATSGTFPGAINKLSNFLASAVPSPPESSSSTTVSVL